MKEYILNEQGEPIIEPDLMKWAQWFKTADRHVAKEILGDVRISTVFLGLDHSFTGGDPILWETMVFGGEFDGEQNRCSGTRKDAQEMHKKMVATVLGGGNG
jgi:hypothetical protein